MRDILPLTALEPLYTFSSFVLLVDFPLRSQHGAQKCILKWLKNLFRNRHSQATCKVNCEQKRLNESSWTSWGKHKLSWKTETAGKSSSCTSIKMLREKFCYLKLKLPENVWYCALIKLHSTCMVERDCENEDAIGKVKSSDIFWKK